MDHRIKIRGDLQTVTVILPDYLESGVRDVLLRAVMTRVRNGRVTVDEPIKGDKKMDVARIVRNLGEYLGYVSEQLAWGEGPVPVDLADPDLILRVRQDYGMPREYPAQVTYVVSPSHPDDGPGMGLPRGLFKFAYRSDVESEIRERLLLLKDLGGEPESDFAADPHPSTKFSPKVLAVVVAARNFVRTWRGKCWPLDWEPSTAALAKRMNELDPPRDAAPHQWPAGVATPEAPLKCSVCGTSYAGENWKDPCPGANSEVGDVMLVGDAGTEPLADPPKKARKPRTKKEKPAPGPVGVIHEGGPGLLMGGDDDVLFEKPVEVQGHVVEQAVIQVPRQEPPEPVQAPIDQGMGIIQPSPPPAAPKSFLEEMEEELKNLKGPDYEKETESADRGRHCQAGQEPVYSPVHHP